MGRQGHGGQMNLWEAWWSAEESQWPKRVLVRYQGGGQRGLTLYYPQPGNTVGEGRGSENSGGGGGIGENRSWHKY